MLDTTPHHRDNDPPGAVKGVKGVKSRHQMVFGGQTARSSQDVRNAGSRAGQPGRTSPSAASTRSTVNCQTRNAQLGRSRMQAGGLQVRAEFGGALQAAARASCGD